MAELKLLRTYRYIGQDPVLGEIREVFKAEGLLSSKGYGIAAKLTGCSPSTYKKWFEDDKKPTLAPTNRTVEATLRALGLKREVTRDRPDFDLDQELKKAARWALQQNSNKTPRKRRNGHATRR